MPEVQAAHPTGKVPAMRHGDLALRDSMAICACIDRAFPGPAPVPADPAAAAAARVEQWVSIVDTTAAPVCTREYLRGHIFPGSPDGSPNRPLIDAAVPRMAPLLAMLERALAPTGHLAGPGFTLADTNPIPTLDHLATFPEAGAMLAQHPALAARLDRHLARPGVARTLPPPLPGRRGQNGY